MPFTPSHIAAVLPFARTPLFPAALVIGSVAPDLFYYVPIDVPRDFSHSPLGIVTVDLALGAVMFLLWQLVFRRPVIDSTPLPVRSRLAAMAPPGVRPAGMRWFRAAVILLCSIAVGAATHVVWDSFTHEGWLVSRLPALAQPVGPLLAYKWLQHASSAVGSIIVIVWLVVWYRRTTPVDPAPSRLTTPYRVTAWSVVAAAGLAVSLLLWIGGTGRGIPPLDPPLVFTTVTVGLGSAGVVTVLFSIVWWFLPARYTERSTATTLPSNSA